MPTAKRKGSRIKRNGVKRAKLSKTEREKRMCEESVPDFFSTSNDDCIFEIFDRLPLNDLCSISRTCKKFKQMAENQFIRKYPELVWRTLRIQKEDGVIGFDHEETERYIQCFSRQCENVAIYLEDKKMDDQLLEFIKTKCSDSIKEIRFYGLNSSSNFQLGIRDCLRSVETIELAENNHDASLCLHRLVNSLPNVKQISIVGSERFLRNVKWSRIECPKLEAFQCDINYGWMVKKLTKFFNRHRTITRFKYYMHSPPIVRVRQILDIVIASENIEELFFQIDGRIDFSLIRDQLKMLDQRNNFKRLTLNLCGDAGGIQNLAELASIKSFAELRFPKHSFKLGRHISALISLSNLQTLRLSCNFTEADADSLSQKLRNLQKLCIDGTQTQASPIRKKVMLFVRNSPKLSSMAIYNPEISADIFDFGVLNAERKKLKDASKLIISFDRDCGSMNLTPRRKTNNNDLVQLKLIPR